MKGVWSKCARVGLVVICLACAVAQAGESVLTKIRQLVEQQKFAQAYQIGRENRQLQGNAQFDFLFGLAAVNSDHIAEGLMALERHLSLVPANDRARLELARAYYQLGAYPRAQKEFEFVLQYRPPLEVRQNIEKYLKLMQGELAASSKSSVGHYIEIGQGYDTNVNAGTFNDSLRLISGVELLEDGDAKQTESVYNSLKLGGQWLKRVDERLAVFAGLDAVNKHNASARNFDVASLAGYMGFSVLGDSGLYRFSLSDSQLWVDGDDYRNTRSMSAEKQYSASQTMNLNAVLQYAELSHTEGKENLDSHLVTLGGEIEKRFISRWPFTLKLRLSAAQESNLAQREDLERDIYGAQLGLTLQPRANVVIDFNVSAQSSQYGARDFAFGSVRDDDLSSASIGLRVMPSSKWLLRLHTEYLENDSNQMLYQYRRSVSSLSIRFLL